MSQGRAPQRPERRTGSRDRRVLTSDPRPAGSPERRHSEHPDRRSDGTTQQVAPSDALDELLLLPGGTLGRYSGLDSKGRRVWAPERAALHRGIIDRALWGARRSGSGSSRSASFVNGGPASGKTTLLRDVLHPTVPGVRINADVYKKDLPEYREWVARGEPGAAAAVHEESSVIARKVLARAVLMGLPILVDSVGGGPPGQYLRRLKWVAEHDYEVKVFFVDAPIEIALQRNRERTARTGRKVDEDVLRALHHQACAAHLEVREATFVTSFEVWSYTGAGGLAMVAFGGHGDYTVLDADEYRRIEDKGHVT